MVQQTTPPYPHSMGHPTELMLKHAASIDSATITTAIVAGASSPPPAAYLNNGTFGGGGGGGDDNGSSCRPFHFQPEPNDLARPPGPRSAGGVNETPVSVLRAEEAGSPAPTTATTAAAATATVAAAAAGGESSSPSSGDGHDRGASPAGACSAAGVDGGGGGEAAPAAAQRVAELEAELRDARDRAKEAEKVSREKEEANGERGLSRTRYSPNSLSVPYRESTSLYMMKIAH